MKGWWLNLFLLGYVLEPGSVAIHPSASFEDSSSEYFDHLALDKSSGTVYIGGVNRLYQLSPELNDVEANLTMGPHEDSPECPANIICPGIRKSLTDYDNKVLLVDSENSRLIACGTLFQGSCTIHSLQNISLYNSSDTEAVVANDAAASTVAFIAPGPSSVEYPKALYVGVTFTGKGPYRSDVPAVSSRSLRSDSMFSLAFQSVTSGTKMMVNSMLRDNYPVSYVHGFSWRGFSYFLTVQMNEAGTRFISKLVRVCQDDAHYYSYTEVPLECGTADGTGYNLAQAAITGTPGSALARSLGLTEGEEVLFAAFGRSESTSSPTDHASALCVYSLPSIQRKFTQNIQRCFNGEGKRGLDFITPSYKCIPTNMIIDDDFCGIDVNTPLEGTLPIHGAPILQYPDTLLTAVAATSVHNYTVAFLGTHAGHLKKVIVESARTPAYEYSDIVIQEGSPVNKDLLLSPDEGHIYVMTMRRVTKVPVQECDAYDTCSECMAARDPYCGWCSTEQRCSPRISCAGAVNDPLIWFPYEVEHCVTITEVQPREIQRTTARVLTIAVDNMPEVKGQVFCVFTNPHTALQTNATKIPPDAITCATPHTDSLPKMHPGQHHLSVKLSLRLENGRDFATTNFTFYDCSSFTTCTQCVSGSFPCEWCVGGMRCTHDSNKICRNDVLVSGISLPSIRPGPGFCPRITKAKGTSPEILIPNGTRKRIMVRMDSIMNFIAMTKFTCQFEIEGKLQQVEGQLLGDTIYCQEMTFDYAGSDSFITAPLEVAWDGDKRLDNPDGIHVKVYSCQNMAPSCGECLELPQEFGCGWCQSSCQVRAQCNSDLVWLDNQETCPDPKIRHFEPETGPLEGGTILSIEGINLGRTGQDIEVNIVSEEEGQNYALAHCEILPQGYVKTLRVLCQLRRACNQTERCGPVSGPIEVMVKGQYQAFSASPYSFVDPAPTRFFPTKGPMSGGTFLTIEGQHMNAGAEAKVFIGNAPCHIVGRSFNKIQCVTPASSEAAAKAIQVTFDNNLRECDCPYYVYEEDPTISKVFTEGHRDSQPRGIPSGGLTLHVQGTNLDTIQEPTFYVIHEGREYNSTCEVKSRTNMTCLGPEVTPLKNVIEDGPLELDFGFHMDNVDVAKNIGPIKYQMYPDPLYRQFDKNGTKCFCSDYLVLEGDNLDKAVSESSIKVHIGSSFCIITSLSRTQLTCRLPSPLQMPIESDGSGEGSSFSKSPQVVVNVGQNLKFVVGRLTRCHSSLETQDILPPSSNTTVY